jgi:hypothetical protein
VEINKGPVSSLQDTDLRSAYDVIHFFNREINSLRGLVRYSHKLLTWKFAAKGI